MSSAKAKPVYTRRIGFWITVLIILAIAAFAINFILTPSKGATKTTNTAVLLPCALAICFYSWILIDKKLSTRRNMYYRLLFIYTLFYASLVAGFIGPIIWENMHHLSKEVNPLVKKFVEEFFIIGVLATLSGCISLAHESAWIMAMDEEYSGCFSWIKFLKPWKLTWAIESMHTPEANQIYPQLNMKL